jgi:hypothetical protein
MPIFGGRFRGGCNSSFGNAGEAYAPPSCQPAQVHGYSPSVANSTTVLSEPAMQGAYDSNQARVESRDAGMNRFAITGAPATGEAAAFRRATAVSIREGGGAPQVDLASSDGIIVTGSQIRQYVENVPVRCGRRGVGHQQQVVSEVVETHQIQSQSVLISSIPDPMGRLQLSLGSNDRAFIDLASVGKNCLINLEKTPGSAGKTVLILGSGRPIESIAFDPAKGTAVLTIGGQEIAVSGISSPQDLLVASSALDASRGVLADIGAVAAAVGERSTTPTRAERAASEGPSAEIQPSPSDRITPQQREQLDAKDTIIAQKDAEIESLKVQMDAMKEEMAAMRMQMQELMQRQSTTPSPEGGLAETTATETPGNSLGAASPGSEPIPPAQESPGSVLPNSSTPSQQPSVTSPAVAPVINYAARAQALNEELSKWRGGTWLTPGFSLGLSSQLKVMHQVSDLTDQQAAQLRAKYQELFNRDLVTDIEGKLSVGRAAALKAKLVAFKPDELAQLMKDNIDAWVIDDPDALVQLVSNLTFEQRQAVSSAFEKLTGGSIMKKLTDDYGLYDRATLIAPFLSGENIRALTEAAELYQLMDGVGYNDEALILATLQRGQATPNEIARVFNTFYAKGWNKSSLLDVLESKVSARCLAEARRLITGSTPQ